MKILERKSSALKVMAWLFLHFKRPESVCLMV